MRARVPVPEKIRFSRELNRDEREGVLNSVDQGVRHFYGDRPTVETALEYAHTRTTEAFADRFGEVDWVARAAGLQVQGDEVLVAHGSISSKEAYRTAHLAFASFYHRPSNPGCQKLSRVVPKGSAVALIRASA